jgi:hypothetical protein
MNDDLRTARVSDCKVCYVAHSDDIHDATLRIRRWLRYEVTRKLTEGYAPEEVEEDPALVGQET